MSDTAIRLGTRRSKLAMAQSGLVARDLERISGRTVELVQITSEGDTNRASLASLGGTGVFATRLREALAAGECDLLVHSLKDLPVAPAPGLVIQATPARADARDIVITRDGTPLDAMPTGARVGTGSPRRIAQVLRANPGVETHDLRGNIDSRMGRVRDGELDAVVLAAAGIGRIDADGSTIGGLHAEHRDLVSWPTAAGQAALAIEARQDADPQLLAWIAELDDPVTRFAVTLERELLGAIEAGCHAPVGVHATVDDHEVRVRADVYGAEAASDVSEDVSVPLISLDALIEGYIQGRGSGEAVDRDGLIARAREIGSDLARRLLDNGAADIVTREAPTS
ncbi:hydroxymethylbilane synthase [Microbacterium amylolyticum]|uniref:Hydroxymethylbilane synthase n=1 Tax=Microbacterium amylolyticum TaxID=936337 RepID=A0ABS4ZI44_9MICO|nr:hydroxymethylbilane synthase [Microbacterium amylolyticum]MBP2436688.1 hydroxymethylbilane synthase [Microbacterium amylolyticum]